MTGCQQSCVLVSSVLDTCALFCASFEHFTPRVLFSPPKVLFKLMLIILHHSNLSIIIHCFWVPQEYDSLRRRATARNVSFHLSLRWPIHIINPVDKTKLSRYTSHRRSATVSLETYPSVLQRTAKKCTRI